MMNTSFSNNKTWRGFCVTMGVLIVALGGAYALAPRPQDKRTDADRAVQAAQVKDETAALNVRYDKAKDNATRFLWTENPDAIAPRALSIVTEAANKNQLKINAFRPQKPTSSPELEELHYVVAIEGRFPLVATFLKAVETPGNRLAVDLFQVTSADGATDMVTATVGLVAFREPKAGAKK